MRRIRVVSLLTVLAFVAGARSARAQKMQTIPDAEAQVSIDAPEGWAKKVQEHELIMVEPSGSALVAVKVMDAADIKGALQELDKDLADLVSSQTWQKPQQKDIHGMPGILVNGNGKMKDGTAVHLGVAIVKSPSGKLVLVGVIADSSKLQALAGDLKAILGSLRPLK